MAIVQMFRPHRHIFVGMVAIVLLLGLLVPIGVTMAAPSAPLATLNVPASGFVGEALSFSVTFDNTDTTDPGYGPYVDVILPAAGADGAGVAADDGITFSGATYLGTTLTPVIPPFICAGGTFTQPLTGIATACTNDTQIVILQLPFGSFTATQPPAPINVNVNLSNLADVGTALPIQARAGFAYGNDPLINPATDPPIVQASLASATYTPQLFKLKKTYIGPEDETATGPNYPRQYRVDVDIATGQTITNLDVSDILSNTMQFVSVDSMLINNAPAATTVITTPSTTTPGGMLTRRFASVTGTNGTQDASVIFTYYIPRLDSASAVIITPTTGDDVTSLDNASTAGSWTPIDLRDVASVPAVNPSGPEHTLTDKSIAIQKSVSNTTDVDNTPGDVLEYTLEVQISDFFALDGIVVDDTFSDGQHFDPTFAPKLQVAGNTYILASSAFSTANFTVTPNYTPVSSAPNDGSTAIRFRVSDELITRGRPNGRMIGGCVSAAGAGLISPCAIVNGSGDGPTTARITFRTMIQDEFTDTYPSGDKSVDEGDSLNNAVTVSGNLLNNIGLTPTGFTETDDSHAQIRIARGNLTKTIYAVNGTICAVQPCANVSIEPGDTVTYRLRRTLPSSDIEGLALIDYLPLPIFDVDDNTALIKSRITTFDTTVSAALPPPGTAKFGPADSFFALAGVNPFHAASANDSIANSVTFDYGLFDSPANPVTTIDILFTVTANSAPFGDGLLLTNQLHEQESSTNSGVATRDVIVPLKIFEPAVNLRKGVIAAYASTAELTATGTLSGTQLPAGVTVNAPGSCARISGTVNSSNLGTTFDSNVIDVDAGARVSFAIVIENTGTSQMGMFDARLRDVLPAGFSYVPTSLCVTDGTGAAMPYTTVGGGLFDASGGIELSDPGPTATPIGALDPGKNLDGTIRNDGRNIAIITFDATPGSTVASNHTYVNTATLYNYSSLAGGTDHTPIDKIDTASVTTLPPAMTKTLLDTSIVTTTNSLTQAVIGELVTYKLVVSVPEGVTPSARITDTLDSGLAFVDVTSITPSAGVSISTPIGVGATPANVQVSAVGDRVIFLPGDITNSNTSNATATITIIYRTVVLDILANQNTPATLLNNSAIFSSANGTLPAASAANVTVIEPTLVISSVASPIVGDAGDVITFDLTITNTGTGTTDAYDVLLSELVPTGMTYVPGSLVNVSGSAATLDATAAPALSASWATLAPGGVSVIRFRAALNANVTPGQSFADNASLQWTSLLGALGQRSIYNTGSTERSGSGGVNDYIRSVTKTITVNSVTPTKYIVTTSEAHTIETGSPRLVAVGEIVRYRLAVQLPEGAAPDFQINDNLPTGLTFLNDGAARVAFVADGIGISSASAESGAIPAVACANDSGSAADLAGLTQAQVDCTLADANISSAAATNADVYATGTDVRFKLGTLTNADSDTNAEFVVVEFNALVDNSTTGSNDAGDTRNNSFAVFLNATTQNGATSGNVQIKVVEPLVSVAKSVSPATGDAGDTINYSVTFSNSNVANTTTAFDIVLTDTLPVQLITITLGVPSSTGTITGLTSGVSGNTISVHAASMAIGASVTITYSAQLSAAVTPGQVISNTALATYTSLPGTNGTTTNPTGSAMVGTPGSPAGERTGAGTAPNDLRVSDTKTVTVFVTNPLKSLVASSESHTSSSTMAIGEIARFRLVVRIAEGNSPSLVLRDNLPPGLLVLNDGTARIALVSTDPGLLSSTLNGVGLKMFGNEASVAGVTPTFVLPSGAISGGAGAGGAFQSGDDPLFALGNLTNTDSDNDQEFVVLEFNALVENILANQGAITLNNTFTLRVAGSDIATSNTTTLTIAEPQLTITKQVLATTGSTVTYQVVASNSGSVTAFDAVVSDTLPLALDLNVGSITITPAGGATIGTASHSDPANRVTFTNLTIPVGGKATITYQATIVTPGVAIANTVVLSGTSLLGSGATGNSTGSVTPGTSGAANGERGGSGGINDYTASAGTSLGSLGDRIWYDVDADGVLDAGEVGIPGVTVNVRWYGPDGVANNADDNLIATTTNSSGTYVVSGLPLGAGAINYRVTVDTTTLPKGLTSATYDLDNGTAGPNSNTVLVLTSSNANPRNADFGYTSTGSLGDRIWLDSNGDGVQNGVALEPGLPGVGVTLTWLGFDGVVGGGDDVTYTTTTGANGSYGFATLPAGSFRADVAVATLPTNVTHTYDLDGTLNDSAPRTLAIGEAATNVDFGYRGAASIGDTVWNDVDASGGQNNAEPGIAGATVTLRWAGRDGALNTADDLISMTTTDASGHYRFPGLPVFGTDDPYQVTVTPPAVYTTQTYDADGTASASQSTLNLGATETNTAQDFGYRAVITQGLSNFVWEDLNGNGRQDSGEPGLAGVTVELYDSAGTNLLATTTTVVSGTYSFPGLLVGSYRVKFGVAPGYTRTVATSAVADDATNSDADRTTGFTGVVAVPANAFNTTVDAGLYRPVTIGDVVWYDGDGDGVQDAGEPGIGGATVTVIWYGPDGVAGGGDDATYSAITTSAGAWTLVGVPAGAYGAAVSTLPSGLTTPTAGSSTFTLVSGTNRDDIDFGYRGAASLGDRIWLDSNGDGVLNGGEDGIGGVAVHMLWAGPDSTFGNADDLSASTTTAPDGSYSFINLPAGSFRVDLSGLPAGLSPTFDLDGISSANVAETSLSAGQNRIDADFGYIGTGSLGNSIWLDVDADGVQDSLEEGIGNITITLTWHGLDGVPGNGDDISFTSTTDGDGAYSFGGLPAGSYQVAVTPPAGMSPTYDLDGIATPSLTLTTLAAGEHRTDADFGYQGSGVIGDRVWFDSDGDGAQDVGEPGLPNVDVALTWAGPDGVFGGTDDVRFNATTDATGLYAFSGLPPGSYRVDVDQAGAPSGTTLTTANDLLAVNLSAGQTYDAADFGFTGTGSLGDFVWLDRNGDGVQDASEPGIGGATVGLTWAGPDGDLATAGDNISYTTSISTSGAYSFSHLAAGPFRVTVDTALLPGGLVPTYDLDSTADSTTDMGLAAGEDRIDVDFGYQGTGAIGDRVWFDSDGDGVQDAGEPGLAAVDITLTWAGPDGLFGGTDDAPFTTTTNAIGGYSFAGLPAGEYRVDVDQADAPAGTAITTSNDPASITLAAGEQRTDVDFGFSGAGSLGDFVWLDRNGDGVQDAGEPGLPGVGVTVVWAGPDGDLATAGDNVGYLTTTDATGKYSVAHLPVGTFSVTIGGLSGIVDQTFDPDSTLDSATSTSLIAGQNRDELDFGYHGSGSIGDRVWSDADGDTVQDLGEPGLAGVTLNLTWYGLDGALGGGDDLTFSTITGANGLYSFTNLPAGTYSVNIDQSTAPGGTTLTTANDPLIITLAAGQSDTSADFGFKGATSLGDFVWLDLNGDGVQDTGEPGIGGVDVTLTWAGPDGNLATTLDNSIYTTTTDSAGAYGFIGVPSGNYRVDLDPATLPGGVSPTYDLDGTGSASLVITTLAAGQNRSEVDFGYQGSGSIGDFVWFDRNGDRLQDAGEPGLPNVTINLIWAGPDGAFGTSDDATLAQTTNLSGGYSFIGLPAGAYRVELDQATAPAGMILTTANDPLPITLAAGQLETSADFGFTGTGALGDRIWNDLDGDGVQDASESGIAGATVTLTWAGPDSALGTADDVTASTTTNLNGSYGFAMLPAGNYRVAISGAPIAGLTPTADPDGIASASTATVTLAAGQNRVDIDFGYRDAAPPATGSIGDRLWVDADGNGAQDAGEAGLANIELRLIAAGPDGLFGSADDLIQTSATDALGNYSFASLPAGSYRVQVNAGDPDLAGYVETSELDGSLNGLVEVLLIAGQHRSDLDFGYRAVNSGGASGAIGDRVWNDANGDGIQDAGENGIAGVTVTLTAAGADGLFGTADDTTATTSTDANGAYSFTGLSAGDYRVATSGAPLAGLYETYELDGSRNNSVTLSLATGQLRTNVDFGYTSAPITPATGAIGDRIWLDLNGDGVQDPGEPGLGGVTAMLTGTGGQVYSQITDVNGDYSFPNLPAGDYTVALDPATLPAGLAATYDLDGGNDGTAIVTLASGQVRTDLDFGYTGTGSLGDRVWNDGDGDQIAQASEAGIAGVPVTLTWAGSDGAFGTADDSSATTTTDAGGYYRFGNLPAGAYRVTVDRSTPALVPTPNASYELDGTLNGTTDIALAGGQNRSDVDFGFTGISTANNVARIGDRLWLDVDGDGAQAAGEPGLAGVTINLIGAGVDGLFGTADDVVYTQVTGADGSYSFTSLPAGVYRVNVDATTLPAGLAGTKERDATINGSTDVTLNAGDLVADADFGYQGVGSLGDRIWFDKNGDGVQDAGEPGIAGVTVTAAWYGVDGVPGGGDDLLLSTTTDASGGYRFIGLPLGNYGVRVGAGVWIGTVETAELDSTLNGSTTASLTPAAPARSDIDFGYTGTGELSRIVWRDADRNGKLDPGESGISGVVITLLWAGPDGHFGTPDDVTTTTTTDVNGNYQFPNLPAGSYMVRVDTSTLSPDLHPTYDKDGGNDSLVTVVLAAGQNIPDINFGYGTTPTAIALASFTATWRDSAVELRWETAAELNTWGFSLYRSATGQREDAVLITPDLIPGQGRGQGGARYSWSDTTAQPGVTYVYWLIETEINGTTNAYGPARALPHPASGATHVFLPLMLR